MRTAKPKISKSRRRKAAARVGAEQGVSSLIPRSNYLNRQLAGVAPFLNRTLAWNFNTTTSSLGVTYAEQAVVEMNNAYDPDSALGGASAAGYAKYMALYSKCYALAARLKVKYAGTGANELGSSSGPFMIGVTVSTLATSLGSTVKAIENGMCDYHVRCQSPDSGVLSVAVDVAKFLHKPKVLDDPQLFSTASADPAQIIVGHVWTLGESTSSTYYLILAIELEIDVVFTDPIPFT